MRGGSDFKAPENYPLKDEKLSNGLVITRMNKKRVNSVDHLDRKSPIQRVVSINRGDVNIRSAIAISGLSTVLCHIE